MPKLTQRWLLFKYIDGELYAAVETPQEEGTGREGAAEIPERERKTIGIGVIGTKG